MAQSNLISDKLVKVFIRTYDKKAKSIKFPERISAEQLKEAISESLNIPTSSLLLYNRGQELQSQVTLGQNTIIHAIDLRNVEQQKINIYIKSLEKDSITLNFEVDSKQVIRKFINQNLSKIYRTGSDDLFLVYTGKQLDADKTFRESFVQNNSELICVKCQEYKSSKKIEIQKHTLANQRKSQTNIILNEGKNEVQNEEIKIKNQKEGEEIKQLESQGNDKRQIQQQIKEQANQMKQLQQKNNEENEICNLEQSKPNEERQAHHQEEQIQHYRQRIHQEVRNNNQNQRVENEQTDVEQEIQEQEIRNSNQEINHQQIEPNQIQEPVVEDKQKVVNNLNEMETDCKKSDPYHQEMIVHKQEPVTHHEEPAIHHEEPVIHHLETAKAHEEPVSSSSIPLLVQTPHKQPMSHSSLPSPRYSSHRNNLNEHQIQNTNQITQVLSSISQNQQNNKLQIIAHILQGENRQPSPHGLSFQQIKVSKASGSKNDLLIYQEQTSLKTNNIEFNMVQNTQNAKLDSNNNLSRVNQPPSKSEVPVVSEPVRNFQGEQQGKYFD